MTSANKENLRRVKKRLHSTFPSPCPFPVTVQDGDQIMDRGCSTSMVLFL